MEKAFSLPFLISPLQIFHVQLCPKLLGAVIGSWDLGIAEQTPGVQTRTVGGGGALRALAIVTHNSLRVCSDKCRCVCLSTQSSGYKPDLRSMTVSPLEVIIWWENHHMLLFSLVYPPWKAPILTVKVIKVLMFEERDTLSVFVLFR